MSALSAAVAGRSKVVVHADEDVAKVLGSESSSRQEYAGDIGAEIHRRLRRIRLRRLRSAHTVIAVSGASPCWAA